MRYRKTLTLRLLLWLFASYASQVVAQEAEADAGAVATARTSWLKLKRDVEATGFSFDMQQFDTPAIPDAENFAAHPLLAELYTGTAAGAASSTRLGKIDLATLPDFPDKIPYPNLRWRESIRYNLADTTGDKDLDPPAAAKKILRGLDTWKAQLDALAEAAKRPSSRLPVDWSKTLTPVGSHDLFKARQHLGLRSLSNLRSGNLHAATNDTLALLRIARHGSADPSLLGVVVTNSGNLLAYQCLWEGLVEKQWTEVSLLLIESELGKIDLRSQFAAAIRFELGFSQKVSSDLINGKRTYDEIEALYGDNKAPTPLQIYESQITTVGRISQFLLDPSTGNPVLDPAKLRKLDELVGDVPNSAPLWHSHRFLGSIRWASISCLQSQADLNNARIAVALERYRLSHGKLPKRLGELTPRYLTKIPIDPMTNREPRYKIRPDGTPAIYSLGWDNDDDGGTPALNTKREGDWVWQTMRPATQANR